MAQSVCLALDGECGGGFDGYCGGCGGCMVMQAVHYGYRLRTTYERRLLTHRYAWDLALEDLTRQLDYEDQELARLARESIEYAAGRRHVQHGA